MPRARTFWIPGIAILLAGGPGMAEPLDEARVHVPAIGQGDERTALLGPATEEGRVPPSELRWPEIDRECRPWTYNWWLGSAVDRGNLARELHRYADAGLGGIHIIPIYGAKGAEERAVEYLSPAWMELLDFAVAEAGRLGLGVDMTTGTGWCFGGPNVPRERGGWRLDARAVDVPEGAALRLRVRRGPNVLDLSISPSVRRPYSSGSREPNRFRLGPCITSIRMLSPFLITIYPDLHFSGI